MVRYLLRRKTASLRFVVVQLYRGVNTGLYLRPYCRLTVDRAEDVMEYRQGLMRIQQGR